MSREPAQFEAGANVDAPIVFSEVLSLFNCPLSAEQVWAIAYGISYALHRLKTQASSIFLNEKNVFLGQHGAISFRSAERQTTTNQLLCELGRLLFFALYYKIPVDEERGDLPEPLEDFLDRLFENDSTQPEQSSRRLSSDEDHAPDEGIDAGCDGVLKPGDESGRIRSFTQVMRVCCAGAVTKGRKSLTLETGHAHFTKVCQAIYQEATDLAVFLHKVETTQQALQTIKAQQNEQSADNNAMYKERDLEDLRTTEWARLWMQVMRQLRTGVTLKKAEDRIYTPHEKVYELAPYEVLMEDIRCKRYNLRKNPDNLSPKLCKDAHEVIMEFIRSRPTLKPVNDRSRNDSALGNFSSSSSSRESLEASHKARNNSYARRMSRHAVDYLNVRDHMLSLIRSKPNLKHIQKPNYNRGLQLGRVVEFMEDGVKRYEGARLLIRPSSLMNLDIDDVSCTEDEGCDADDGVFADELCSPLGGAPLGGCLTSMKGDSKGDAAADKTGTPVVVNGGNWSSNTTIISVQSNDRRGSDTSLVEESSPDKAAHRRNGQGVDEDEDMENEEEDEDTDGCQTPTQQASSVEDIVREFSTSSSQQTAAFALRPPLNRFRPPGSKDEGPFRRRKARLSTGSVYQEQIDMQTMRNEQKAPTHSSVQQICGSQVLSPEQERCKMCRNGVDGRDFLNLTVDEMMHIRQVLTKAELDNLSLPKDLLCDIKLEIICFLCKTTRFNLFKKKFKCKFCEKCVCKSCCRSIQLPQSSLLKVPITILSPSASSTSRFMDRRNDSSCGEGKNCSSNSLDGRNNSSTQLNSNSISGSKPPTTSAEVTAKRSRRGSSQLVSKQQQQQSSPSSRNQSFDVASSTNDPEDCLLDPTAACCLPPSTSKWDASTSTTGGTTPKKEEEGGECGGGGGGGSSSSSSTESCDSSAPESSSTDDGHATPNQSPFRGQRPPNGNDNNQSATDSTNCTTDFPPSLLNNRRGSHLYVSSASAARSSSACRPGVGVSAAGSKRMSAQYRSQHSSSVRGGCQRERSVDVAVPPGVTSGQGQSLVTSSAYTSNSASTDNILGGAGTTSAPTAVANGGVPKAPATAFPSRDRGRPPIASEPPIAQNMSATIQQQKAMKQISGLSAVKTQVCKSCHKFLKHVLHTNTSSNYFCTASQQS